MDSNFVSMKHIKSISVDDSSLDPFLSIIENRHDYIEVCLLNTCKGTRMPCLQYWMVNQLLSLHRDTGSLASLEKNE